VKNRRAHSRVRALARAGGALLVVLGATVGCSGEDGPALSGSEASYEHFEDAEAMLDASALVVEIAGSPMRTDRSVELESHRVEVAADGTAVAETHEVPVFEVVVDRVAKGDDELSGQRVLVVPAVDHESDPPASQSALLESVDGATLYLVDLGQGGGLWTTLSPYQGIVAE
jgi:hypothetical protein